MSNKFTKENAAENGRKGGIASGEVRAAKAELANAAKFLLDLQAPEDTKAKIKQLFPKLKNKDITAKIAVMARLTVAAMNGDFKAYELLRDQIGEKPKDIVETTNTNYNANVTDAELIKKVVDKIGDIQ